MLTPVGSLPPAIYWKRRLAGGVALLVVIVLLLLWFNRGDPSAAAGSGQQSGALVANGTTQLQLVPTPLNTAAPSGPTTSGASPSGSGTATTSGTASSTAAPSTTAAPTTTAAAEPVACGDEMLGLAVAPTSPSYSVSDKPTLVLTVTNVAAGACFRDFGGVNPEYTLYSGTTRIWGSNDCFPGSDTNVQTLQPAQSIQLSVVWSGQTSDPGCTTERTHPAPGNYLLRATLGAAVSPDFPLILT